MNVVKLLLAGLMVTLLQMPVSASKTGPVVSSAAPEKVSALEWPDYSRWPVAEKEGVEIYGDGELVGRMVVRYDKLDNPAVCILEDEVLGNGVVMRFLIKFPPSAQIIWVGILRFDQQLLVDGQWVGILRFKTKWQKDTSGALTGVEITAVTLDGKEVKTTLANKMKK